MDKLVKKLWIVGLAFIITLSSATIVFAGGPGDPPSPVIPRPPRCGSIGM